VPDSPGSVRLRDGVEFDLPGRLVVADADEPGGDAAVISHAHADHLPESPVGRAVCSPLTARLAGLRREAAPEPAVHPAIDLLPSGHIPGSRAAVIEDREGHRYLYTGDVSVRDRFGLAGFEPVAADTLVIESTYGRPGYDLPDQAAAESRIVDWLAETAQPVLLFGYALGRAQELQLLAERAGRDRVFVTDAVARLNDPIEAALDVAFPAREYGEDVELRPGDALVLPTGVRGLPFVSRLREAGAIAAGFSGWAVDDAFRYRGDYDVTFPLSDHADFGELVDIVDAVAPDRVYTTHGFTDALADALVARGHDAVALKPDQTVLDEF